MAFFNPIRPSYIENPYPALARLRAEEPVYYSRELSAWVVTRYADCARALREPTTFCSDFSEVHSQWWDETRTRNQMLLGGVQPLARTEPPHHHRMRDVVSGAYTHVAVQGLRPYIESAVDRLLDGVRPGRPFDLMQSFARPLPQMVIAEQLGIAEQDRETVMGDAYSLVLAATSTSPPEQVRRASEARISLLAYLAHVGVRGTGYGDGGVLARMLDARRGGELSEAELLALAVDVAMAGNDATAYLIGNGTLALLQHPEQFAALGDEPALMTDSIGEFLRYDSPVQAVSRVVAIDVRLGGKQLDKGDLVYLTVGAANRDPAQFPAPDRLHLRREDRRYLSFGAGPITAWGPRSRGSRRRLRSP
ncbi:MAG: cytochrome P450 [Dehalococcoidia bacterium]